MPAPSHGSITRASLYRWGAGVLLAVGSTLALGRVLFLFLFITMDPRATWDALQKTWLSPLWMFGGHPWPFVILLVTTPAAAFYARRAYHSGGVWPALFVLLCAGFGVLLTHSYRFSAVVATFGVGICLARRWRRGQWAMLVLATSLCLLPVDVSLRIHPEGARFIPAYYSWGNLQDPTAAVWVGGCTDVYDPPRWFWVW